MWAVVGATRLLIGFALTAFLVIKRCGGCDRVKKMMGKGWWGQVIKW